MSERTTYNNFKIALLEKWHDRLVRCRVGTDFPVCKQAVKGVYCDVPAAGPLLTLAVNQPGFHVPGNTVTPACRCSGLGQDGRETSGEGLALDLSGSEDRPSIQGWYPGGKGSSATLPAQLDPSHPNPPHTSKGLFDWLVSVIPTAASVPPPTPGPLSWVGGGPEQSRAQVSWGPLGNSCTHPLLLHQCGPMSLSPVPVSGHP